MVRYRKGSESWWHQEKSEKLTVEASAASGLVIHYDMCEKRGEGY